MRWTLTVAVLAALLTGCGRDDAPPPIASAAPSAVTTAASSAAPATLDGWIVYRAFEAAGLRVQNPRDNSAGCADLGCRQIITTDAVSIYVWPDVASAEHAASVWSDEGHRAGLVVLSYAAARTPVADRPGYERILRALG